MDRRPRGNRIDLTKMLLYMLKRAWLIVLCAEIGFGAMWLRGNVYIHHEMFTGYLYGVRYYVC